MGIGELDLAGPSRPAARTVAVAMRDALGRTSPCAAPIWAATSDSMSSATIHATDSRTTSACSELISLSASSAAVILRFSAIVVLSFVDLVNRPTIRCPRWPAYVWAGLREDRYTTSTDLTAAGGFAPLRRVQVSGPCAPSLDGCDVQAPESLSKGSRAIAWMPEAGVSVVSP